MTTTVLAYFPSPPRGVWHLGPVPIRAYALFIIVGIVAALLIGDRRWSARGGERGVIYDIALWAVPFGLIGGRLYHLATDWRTYFAEGGAGWGAALRIWDGGLGIWGAVALGGVGAWIGCRRRGIPLPAFGDAIAPGIVLAQAVGRLGNYFNQELFGRETTMPWGLETFYRRDPAGFVDVHSLDGVSTGQLAMVVQPTFLYELLWNLVVFVVLIYVDRRFKMGHGRLFALYVAGYCVGRFCIELLRDDTATHIAGIRINSFTSTFVFIGAVVYLILAPKGREDPGTLGGPAPAEPEAAPEPTAELVTAAAAIGTPTAAAIAAAVGAADEATTMASPEPGVETEAIATAAEEAEEPEVEQAEAIAVVGAAAEDAEAPAVDESESAEPVADQAEAQEPEPEEAVAAEPAVDEVEAAEPAVAEVEAAEPAVAEVGAAEPEPEELVVDEAEATEPEPEEVEAEEPEFEEAEAEEPEEPVAAEPDVEEPEAAAVDDAEAAEPQLDEVEAAEPQPDEAEAKEPGPEKPVAAEPEAEAPQAEEPAPKAPDSEEPAAQLPGQPSPSESVGRWRSRLSRLRRRSGQ